PDDRGAGTKGNQCCINVTWEGIPTHISLLIGCNWHIQLRRGLLQGVAVVSPGLESVAHTAGR
ncbi:hypothetical protein SARC_12443, partial [Sphaeroforma arctica JP610]